MIPKPITRKIISEFSTRSSATTLYTKDSAEYERHISSMFNDVWNYESMLFSDEIFEHNGRYGVKHNALGVLVPPIYDEICDYIAFHEYGNSIYLAKLNNKYGLVKGDGKGSIAYPFELDGYLYTEALNNGLIIVKDGKCGAISILYGKVVDIIEPIYDAITSIEDFEGCDIPDIVMLEKDGKYGLFLYGNIIPPIYDKISIPSVMGWIRVKIGGEWYYIDSDLQPTQDVEKAFHTYTSHFPYNHKEEE